jgi:hypothetical protein
MRELPALVRLEIEIAANPIVGTLRDANGTPHRFTGRLGVLAALDAARLRAQLGEQPGCDMPPHGRR